MDRFVTTFMGGKMKLIKRGIVVIFIVVTIVFIFNWYEDKNKMDTTFPEIQLSSDILEVSVKADEKELLQGIVARDGKDGNITNNVMIESISKFVDKKAHICNITYAVADSDDHVSKKTRKLKYTDYESPKFTLARPLCFNVGETVKLSEIIGATDVIDGDISSRVKVLSGLVSTYAAGEYTLTAQVTNSLGDTSKIKLMYLVRVSNRLKPEIKLKENIVYLGIGDSFNAKKYIDTVKDYNGKKISNSAVKVTSFSVDMKKAGVYNVEYTVIDKDENEGNAYLTVVVEE